MSKSRKEKLKEAIMSGKVKDEASLRTWIITNDLSEKIDEELPNIKNIISKVKGDRGPQGPQGPQGLKGEDGKNGRNGKDGKDGKDGKTPTKEEIKEIINPLVPEKKQIVDDVLVKVEKELPQLGEPIRDSLELLRDDNRLDIKAIRGLDNYTEISKLAKTPKVGGGSTARNFYQLYDAPQGYVGMAGSALRVKTDELGLEFYTPSGDTDEKVKVDSAATAGYIGASSTDGVLRTGGNLTYTDGGDYVTIDANITSLSNTFSLSTHNHTGVYQPLDADLTAIAALGFSSTGFLRKIGVNAYDVDTTTYLTAEVNDLSAAVTWANVPDANITQSSVTQHQGAIDHGSIAGLTDDDHPQYLLISDSTAVITQTKLDDFATPDDNTDLNATSTYHGLLPKLDNTGTKYLRDDGTWQSVGGTGTVTTIKQDYVQVGDADIVTLNFDGTAFALTESPDTHINIDVNEAGIDHDALANFVANEHIDWTTDQGATDINAQNIPDLSATYQLYDATLTALAGLDSSAGIIKQVSSNVFASITDSSADWNTAYGWGDHSTQGYLTASSTATLIHKRITRRVATTNAPGATPTTNTDNVDVMYFTGLDSSITSMTTNLSGTPADGDLLEFRFLDNGTARAITWGASFANTTVTAPTTTVVSTILRAGFEYRSASSKWECIAKA